MCWFISHTNSDKPIPKRGHNLMGFHTTSTTMRMFWFVYHKYTNWVIFIYSSLIMGLLRMGWENVDLRTQGFLNAMRPTRSPTTPPTHWWVRFHLTWQELIVWYKCFNINKSVSNYFWDSECYYPINVLISSPREFEMSNLKKKM